MSAPKHPAHTPWSVLDEQTVFERPPYLRVTQQRLRTGDGTLVEDFYQVQLRRFGLVVPFLEDGRVQLIRQYKHGPGKVSLSFPSGFIDDGEAPEAGARRELLEEAGLVPEKMVKLADCVDNGNQRGCHGFYYLATGCRQVAAPDPGDLEAFEYLTMTPNEVDAAVFQGGFSIVHHIAGWGMARLSLSA